jgi:hypothetical protein
MPMDTMSQVEIEAAAVLLGISPEFMETLIKALR